jgi:1-acyl-sn-glycerol-3-phosphate acyltransferase
MVKLVSKKNLFYSIGYLIVRALLRVVWRLEIHGGEKVPENGGVIVSPTHKSYFDPPVIGAALPREAYFMAKRELFRVPILGSVIKRLNAFPVARGGFTRDAINKSIELLKKGAAVVIFPEGHRQKGDVIVGECKAGVGMVCSLSGAPILPVLIVNSHHWMKFKKIEVWFGEMIDINFDKGGNRYNYQEIANLVKERIEELWKRRRNCRRRCQQ